MIKSTGVDVGVGMNISVVTLFPELISSFLGSGIPRIAVEKDCLKISTVNPRNFTTDRHRTVDDRPYGGGPGMVMKVEPLVKALGEAKRIAPGPVIYLSPQGQRFDQAIASELAVMDSAVLLCGRYEGIDERVCESEVDMELSLGDFVLSGGEVAAMAVIDALARLQPGVLGDGQSAEQDSFGPDRTLDCPHYTRPEVLDGLKVPDVLMSGDHRKIAVWRRERALERTWRRRPDLLNSPEFRSRMSFEDQRFLMRIGATLKALPVPFDGESSDSGQ